MKSLSIIESIAHNYSPELAYILCLCELMATLLTPFPMVGKILKDKILWDIGELLKSTN